MPRRRSGCNVTVHWRFSRCRRIAGGSSSSIRRPTGMTSPALRNARHWSMSAVSTVAGQGMNMGIQDAFNLAWKLSLVLRNGKDPQLLDSYEAERKPVDEAVIRQTDRATRLVSLHGSVTRFVRDHLMSFLTQIPTVVEKLGEGLSGLAVNYRRSPIVEERGAGMGGPDAGDRAPDAPLGAAKSGAPVRLYDLFAEHRHVLL